MPFLGVKLLIYHEQHFFGTNHYYYFHLPIGPFHCQKFKKILTLDPELWGWVIFGPKMVHLPRTFLFWKIINFHHYQSQNYHYHNDIIIIIIIIIVIYPLVSFIGQNFKKIVPGDPELWGCAFFGPKMAHFLKWEFFQKIC